MTAAPLPWMKFSPDRWRNDEALRMCGAAARGVWMELICIMHRAEPYGHLLIRGKQPTDRQLSVLSGLPLGEILEGLEELEAHEVFSRTVDGAIYSRGMVRDKEVHDEMSRRGAKGAKHRYQKPKGKTGSHSSGNGTSNGRSHSLESEEERESEKNPSVISPPATGEKTHLPEAWKPGPFGKDSAAGKIVAGWDQDRIDREFESFQSHHRTKGSRYSDWQDTWGTWVRNARGYEERDDRRAVTVPKTYLELAAAEAERDRLRESAGTRPKSKKKAAALGP